jgi:hypothetical protein
VGCSVNRQGGFARTPDCLMLGRAAADTADMLPGGDAALPASWTYVNGDAFLRLHVVEVGRVLHLLVSSSTGHRESHEFADRQALLTYHARYDAQLQAHGYTLVATMYDRRRGGDRRRHPHPGRRRQPVGSR